MPQHNHRARKSNEIREKYNELLLAVTNKFPGETRHQTALRYIKEAEVGSAVEARLKAKGYHVVRGWRRYEGISMVGRYMPTTFKHGGHPYS